MNAAIEKSTQRKGAWLALCIAGFASACSSAPTRIPEARNQSIPTTAARDAAASDRAPPPFKEKAFYNLAPLSLSPEELAIDHLFPRERVSTAAEIARSEKAPSIPQPAPRDPREEISRLPDSALIGELQQRWSREWASASNAPERSAGDTNGGDKVAASKRGLALSFLRGDHGADDPALLEAARVATSSEAGADARLLAAAYYSHMGSTDEAADAVAGLFEAEPSQAEGATNAESPRSEFEIASLSFASSIEGPGKFTPATSSELAAGKSVLVYGEFRNFKNDVEHTKDAGAVYKRSFSASLKLVGPDGVERDKLEFLPESRGLQQSPSRTDVTNFWAKYKLPVDLEPGSYKVIIEATDVLGGANTSSELAFTLSRTKRVAQPR